MAAWHATRKHREMDNALSDSDWLERTPAPQARTQLSPPSCVDCQPSDCICTNVTGHKGREKSYNTTRVMKYALALPPSSIGNPPLLVRHPRRWLLSLHRTYLQRLLEPHGSPYTLSADLKGEPYSEIRIATQAAKGNGMRCLRLVLPSAHHL